MKKLADLTIDEYLTYLAAKEPVPNGGGSAALAGALGVALGGMSANYTLGKNNSRVEEDQVILIKNKLLEKIEELKILMQKDADGFLPLSETFSLPASTEAEKTYKREKLEENYLTAAKPPLEIMRSVTDSLDLLQEIIDLSTAMVVSDAATGIANCQAALKGAALAVRINTKEFNDKEKRRVMNEEAEHLLNRGNEKAEKLFRSIYSLLGEE